MQHKDVVIIGGGPAGRVIVHDLHNRNSGYSKWEQPRQICCAISMPPIPSWPPNPRTICMCLPPGTHYR